MAVYFPGTIGLLLRRFTPEFRYDIAIAGGHLMFGAWIYPETVSEDQEILVIVDRTGSAPPLDAVVYAVLRIEGAIVASGTVTVILQSSVFGFCVVRRSVPGTLVANQWQRVDVVCATAVNDCHLYVDGVEATYAFTRSEALLPPAGGSEILFGSTFRGDGITAPHYAAGTRTVFGHPGGGPSNFTTAPGGFFRGGMQHPGFWHAGAPSDPGVVQALADGYSPSFFQHYLESSSVSRALLMCPALYGDGNIIGVVYNPEEEFDPKSGIKLEYTLGAGACSWMDGPGVVEPCIPDLDAPAPPIPTLPRLCLPFGLPTAGLYTNPGNLADLLPIVYGDFREGGLRGPVPATLIDRGDPAIEPAPGPFVYCAAWHPSVSVEKVYIGDIEQSFSLDTVDPTAAIVVSLSNNFQNRGPITTITFIANAANPMLSPEGQPIQEVSWRGRGHYDADGLLVMENVVDQFVHLLTTFGSFSLEEDFDGTSLAEARATVETLGYRTAFVVISREVTQEWLTEMLFNVMGYWRINGREQVEMRIDPGGNAFTTADLQATAVAARDCLDGDDGVSITLDRQAIVNALTAYYLYSWSLDRPSSVIVSERDPVSIAAYGEIRKAVTLKGLRRAQDVATWAAILFQRQSARTRIEGATVQCTLVGARFAHLSIGDLIAFTWPYGPTRETGNPYANEILRIVELAIDATRGGAFQILAVDLGAYLTAGGSRVLAPVEI